MAAPATAQFVGVKGCVSCHEKETTLWRGSHHDLAMQEPSEKTVVADFNDTTFTYFGVTSTFYRKDGRYFVRTYGPDGQLHEYPIAYTFGIYPLQQFLIAFPGGRYQALNVCWDTRPKAQGGPRWFHLYPELRMPGLTIPWLKRIKPPTPPASRATQQVKMLPKTSNLESKMCHVKPAMAPRKVIPIPEKSLRKSTKAIAENVTTQPTSPNSITINMCKRLFIQNRRMRRMGM